MKSCLSIIILLFAVSDSLLVRKNVIFEKLHEISSTHNRWMITMVTDLAPYQVFIDDLYTDLNEINRITMALMMHLSRRIKETFFSLAKV